MRFRARVGIRSLVVCAHNGKWAFEAKPVSHPATRKTASTDVQAPRVLPCAASSIGLGVAMRQHWKLILNLRNEHINGR